MEARSEAPAACAAGGRATGGSVSRGAPSSSSSISVVGGCVCHSMEPDVVGATPWVVEATSADAELEESGDHLCRGPAPVFRGGG